MRSSVPAALRALALVPLASLAAAQGSDDCSTPTPIAGDTGTFPWNNTTATTGTEGQNDALCTDGSNQTAITNDLWWVWTPTSSGMARVFTCSQTSADTKIAAWPGGGCPADGTAIACDDDGCIGLQSDISFPVVGGQQYMLQIGNWPGGNPGNGSFKTQVLGVTAFPFCFCDTASAFPTGACGNPGAPGNGCANGSNAAGANLLSTGTTSSVIDDLVLVADGAIPSQPGLFFQGQNAISGGNGILFGDGLRCAGMNVIRLQVVLPDASGHAETSIDVAAKGQVAPGDVRHYQYWYRDPAGSPCGSGFNLSNGWTVNWM